MDDESNRCLARVVAVNPRSVTLEPLWQTFVTPEQSRLLPEPLAGPYRISLANATSILVAPVHRVWPERRELAVTSGQAEPVPA
jgi:hypothetical protein